jgi:acetylglutamate/LysW-gamma-L-alpha-aminoadipate kinase
VVSPGGVRSRYTSAEELEVFVMVLGGLLNKRIAAGLAARGARPVGLTGVDGLVLTAERRKRIVVLDEATGRKRVISGGYTGRITGVNAGFLRSLLEAGYTPVLAPIAYDPGEAVLLNVDGDQAAARVAAALQADALVVLTDVDGLILDGRVVERLTVPEAKKLVEEGRIGKGMNRKIIELVRALEAGVSRAVIANASHPDPIAAALEGRGTLLEPG